MTTQLYLANAMVEGRRREARELTLTRNVGMARREARRARRQQRYAAR